MASVEQPVKSAPSSAPTQIDFLLELVRRARSTGDPGTLRFVAVNDTHLLAPYQQAALWFKAQGVQALSGLTEVERNAPYVQWLNAACAALAGSKAGVLQETDLPAALRAEREEWLPRHVLWIPFGAPGLGHASGGLLFAREVPWRDYDIRLFVEWIETWFCAWRAATPPRLLRGIGDRLTGRGGLFAKRGLLCFAAVSALLLFPVRQSVLAPGELAPAHPAAIRAPLGGGIKTFFVRSNEPVRKDQPLFAYEDQSLKSRLDSALESLRTAETEERQYGQLALNDQRARALLASARGRVEEKRVEVSYLEQQLARTQVLAPGDGVAFIDDTAQWIGRPVVTGQRIMRLADPADKKIEAWLPAADAIDLPPGSPAKLYLSATPLDPVSGRIEYTSFDTTERADGIHAYRVSILLDGETPHRAGLKGTARLSGGRVPLIYWMLRRPIAAARAFLGV